MDGMEIKVEAHKIVIEIDTKKCKPTLSESGKNLTVASTRGNTSVAVDNKVYRLGVNLFTAK